jgi:uncharacterized membrane protein YbhN (UPF0104 family)
MSDANTKGDAKPEHHLASHIFNVVVLVGGAIGLVVLMRQLGWDQAKDVFQHVGAWFGVILALDITGMALDARAIHSFMRPEQRMVSYWRVFAAQASGRAINIFVPGGVVGEATKLSMLVSHAPRARVLSSIVLFNLATFYISVAIMLIGVPITALTVPLPHQLAVAVWVGLAVLVPLVVAVGVIIHRGAFGTAVSTLRGARIISAERAKNWKARLAELDKHLRRIHSDDTGGVRTGLVLLLVSRVVAWTTTAIVLHAVGVTLSVKLLVGVLSVGVLVSWISAVVPFGIGIADGSMYALFDVLGASGANGVFVTMLGRARSLAIALIGLAIMAVAHSANRVSVARRNRHSSSPLR